MTKKAKNPVKVVYNACFGGFGLSDFACERLMELGVSENEIWSIPRHDPRLVEVVEKYGINAVSGVLAKLEVYTLKGRKYIVEEYGGCETVREPKDIVWIKVK